MLPVWPVRSMALERCLAHTVAVHCSPDSATEPEGLSRRFSCRMSSFPETKMQIFEVVLKEIVLFIVTFFSLLCFQLEKGGAIIGRYF